MLQSRLVGALREFDPGCTIERHDRARSAIASLLRDGARTDLLLVDIGLPDGSGIEVIRAARCASRDMPILVCSIRTDEAVVLDAIRAGAHGYLIKDDSAIGIADAIRRIVAGEFPISPAIARFLFRLAAAGAADVAAPFGGALASRELELLRLLAKGTSYKHAALSMGVSLATVQTYVRRIYQKLEAHSKIEAISRARDLRLIG